jgi:hypothetical protein
MDRKQIPAGSDRRAEKQSVSDSIPSIFFLYGFHKDLKRI